MAEVRWSDDTGSWYKCCGNTNSNAIGHRHSAWFMIEPVANEHSVSEQTTALSKKCHK